MDGFAALYEDCLEQSARQLCFNMHYEKIPHRMFSSAYCLRTSDSYTGGCPLHNPDDSGYTDSHVRSFYRYPRADTDYRIYTHTTAATFYERI